MRLKLFRISLMNWVVLILILLNNKMINKQIMEIEYYNESDFAKIKKIDIHLIQFEFPNKVILHPVQNLN